MREIAERLRRLPRDTMAALAFFSRLPLAVPFEPGAVGRGAGVWPLVGVLVALPAAGTLLLLRALDVPGLVAVPLALGAGALATGALHEDGLADTADGLFGGRTPEDRLRIMRDHAIGAFGALTLLLTLFSRAAALALLSTDPWDGALTLLLVAAAARAVAAFHWGLLPFARADGLAHAAGRPDAPALLLAGVLGATALALLGTLWGTRAALLGAGLAVSAVMLISLLARRLIGGATGDTIGAAEQIAETLLLAGLASGWAPPMAFG